MNKKLKWGILGPGNIANQFVKGLKVLPDAEILAVGSRSIERASAFADQYDIPKRYGSYEELAGDPEIDVIYVATPHPLHKEHSILCLESGKAVICEKPMAINADEARQVIECARTNNVFFMEAMWTRFLPIITKVREWLSEGIIGEVRMLTADFGFRTGWDPNGRLLNPNLGGGAILDVGVYTVAFASMIYGDTPSKVESITHIGETGVDEQSAMLLGYDHGGIAILSCAVRTNTPQEARIMGTDGWIHIPNFWRATTATLQASGKEKVDINIPFEGTGYNYEAAEVMRCIQDGKIESPVMSHAESIAIAETLERVRDQLGIKYPME